MGEAMDGGELRRRKVAAAIWKEEGELSLFDLDRGEEEREVAARGRTKGIERGEYQGWFGLGC